LLFVIYDNGIDGRIFLFIARLDSCLRSFLFQALCWVFGVFIAAYTALEATDNTISRGLLLFQLPQLLSEL
jgi:hypothetical protein